MRIEKVEITAGPGMGRLETIYEDPPFIRQILEKGTPTANLAIKAGNYIYTIHYSANALEKSTWNQLLTQKFIDGYD